VKALWRKFWQKAGAITPQEFLSDPESSRRARLISRFGVLGSVFGTIYATFYLGIGHYWGTVIVLICSLAVGLAPYLMLKSRSLSLAGNFLSFILTLGFGALCCIEGGLHGHAIAWFVSIPLCAFLLVGQIPARWWVVVCVITAGAIAGIDLAGLKLPVTYDLKWHSWVSAAGYLGLILFMFILGMVFESGREKAFSKMSDALSDLAASNERLVHLNNEKNEFLGIAAHDLKNPLTAIIGSAELLTVASDGARVSRLAQMILGAGTRMRDLITNLLDANAIEEGRFTSKTEPCDLRQLVEQCVENNRATAAGKEIQIQITTCDNPVAKADRAATMQILDNLISNALKYSPRKTTVNVQSSREGGCVLIAVKDEGPGISAEDQRKMFQKFTRLSAKPTGGESSNGLGLSIVKRLAEAISGAVVCDSTLGFGATFTLRLPAWSDVSQEAVQICKAPVTTVPSPKGLAGSKIIPLQAPVRAASPENDAKSSAA